MVTVAQTSAQKKRKGLPVPPPKKPMTNYFAPRTTYGSQPSIKSAMATKEHRDAVDNPELQTLAIRILSQCCSSSGCELNWSIFEHIHSPKRNILEHEWLNDLVFVHYNLKLCERN
eukprot:TRINITY_DN35308_c0_g3_i1.p1 TRINITY_DN35308_c0_g3~~TRINITY_DN35308_c0_g3_i1.p1  ORF type:complete len:116 (+),score=13.80 TRINITY_DN35308_c0_g3_i1:559-906(+)